MATRPRYDSNGYRKLDGIDTTPRRQIKGFSASQRPSAYAWARMSSQQRGAMGSQREFQKRLDAQAFRQVTEQERQRQQQIHDQGKQDAMGAAMPQQAPATQKILDDMKGRMAGGATAPNPTATAQPSTPAPAVEMPNVSVRQALEPVVKKPRPKRPMEDMEWTPEQMAAARRRAADRSAGMNYDRNGQVVRNW